MTTQQEKLKQIRDSLKGGTKLLSVKPEQTSSKVAEKPKVEKVEKPQGKTPGHGSLKDNGGRRNGSGRKPLGQDEKRTSIKKSWEDYADEEVEVRELHKGTKETRVIKMQRLRVAQEKLFQRVKDGDVSAIKEFNDRVGGKARQPLVGDDEEDPITVDIGIDRILDKVYGDKKDE